MYKMLKRYDSDNIRDENTSPIISVYNNYTLSF